MLAFKSVRWRMLNSNIIQYKMQYQPFNVRIITWTCINSPLCLQVTSRWSYFSKLSHWPKPTEIALILSSNQVPPKLTPSRWGPSNYRCRQGWLWRARRIPTYLFLVAQSMSRTWHPSTLHPVCHCHLNNTVWAGIISQNDPPRTARDPSRDNWNPTQWTGKALCVTGWVYRLLTNAV